MKGSERFICLRRVETYQVCEVQSVNHLNAEAMARYGEESEFESCETVGTNVSILSIEKVVDDEDDVA